MSYWSGLVAGHARHHSGVNKVLYVAFSSVEVVGAAVSQVPLGHRRLLHLWDPPLCPHRPVLRAEPLDLLPSLHAPGPAASLAMRAVLCPKGHTTPSLREQG